MKKITAYQIAPEYACFIKKAIRRTRVNPEIQGGELKMSILLPLILIFSVLSSLAGKCK